MSTQREIPTVAVCKCVCGKIPRTYRTDGKLYHLECYPCQHITIRLHTQRAANMEFARMMEVKKADEAANKAPTVADMAAGVRQ